MKSTGPLRGTITRSLTTESSHVFSLHAIFYNTHPLAISTRTSRAAPAVPVPPSRRWSSHCLAHPAVPLLSALPGGLSRTTIANSSGSASKKRQHVNEPRSTSFMTRECAFSGFSGHGARFDCWMLPWCHGPLQGPLPAFSLPAFSFPICYSAADWTSCKPCYSRRHSKGCVLVQVLSDTNSTR